MGASGQWRWVLPGLAFVVLLFGICCSAHEAAHDHGSCPFGDRGSGHHDNGKHNGHHHHLHHQDHGCQGRHSHSHLEMSARGKLPEELAEEEDLAGDGSDYHGIGGDVQRLSGLGLWVNALGCSLLVSMASLICLITLPLIFFHGKPSKLVVECLAVFGAGAMLGDAFLHQLPHALGGAHSHSSAHDDHSHDFSHAHANQSHSHSLNDLAIGLSVLAGIVLFLLVEKCVRYAEDYSESGSWGHVHHHHHHRNSSKSKKDKDEKDVNHSQMDDARSTDSKCDANNNSIRKRNTSTETITDKTSESDGVISNSTEDEVSSAKDAVAPTRSSLVFGYLNLFSDGVHNFTDGMALGSAFLVYGSVGGWSRTLFLLAHELPQEVGDFGILIRSGFSVPKALFFNFLSALVALGGTALALLLGKDPGHSSLIEGFTAGGFIYIAVAGVLPEINRENTTIKTTVAQLTALVLGMSIALGISLVE